MTLASHHLMILATLIVGLLPCSLMVSGSPIHEQQQTDAVDRVPADSGASPQRQKQIARLQPIAVLTGAWRGVGQPQRGSRNGAWIESASGIWQFTKSTAAVKLTSKEGKLFDSMEWSVSRNDQLQLLLTLPDGSQVVCIQQGSEPATSAFVLESASTEATGYRTTLRVLSEIRVTVLVEQRSTVGGSFRRIAEVGYTRAGERLATSNSGERQCIVTGGLGTMAVSFEGRTYYVCCEGCRQAFEADPKGTIEAYRERIRQATSPAE